MDTNIEVAHFESLYPANSRYEEIEKLLDYVKQGHSCQIVGLPGSGQSTFLKLLSTNKNVRTKHLEEEQNQYHFVLTNFSEVRKRPLVEVMKFMFLSLVDSLQDRSLKEEYDKTYAVFKESISLNDELVLFQGLKHAIDFLTLEKNLTIVFLFDRFEEYIPSLTTDFFSNLRTLRNRAKYKFSAVFSVSRPLEDSIETALLADFSEFLTSHIVYLPLLDKPGLEFRITHMESITHKTISEDLQRQTLALTGGLGRLTKNCILLLLSDSQENKISNEKQLSEILLSDKKIQATLYDIWQALSPSEQDFLSSQTQYNQDDVDYLYLSKVGLLNQSNIAIPLLREFMKKQLPVIEKQNGSDVITLDPVTNEIKQGKTIVSDRLTSSEFRLLRFLLEHADTVVDRESIINAVWKNTASTAGVTDQALDQLLFRVRKKIEDDPNLPQHIQTVKGRGIRFKP